jgi:hypothetical protein
MNHNKYQSGSGAHRDPGWDRIGEDTQFFDNYEDAPVNTDTLTWFEILLIPPKAGNAYLILAHQYVAAWLNIANGANPSLLGTAMADADAVLTTNTGFGTTAGDTWADHFTPTTGPGRELASARRVQQRYLGPGHCR